MNKSGLVNEVKSQLGVSTARAKTLVDAIFDEIAGALAQGEAITMRGFGFTPESDRTWAAATDTVSSPKKSAKGRSATSSGKKPASAPAGKFPAGRSPASTSSTGNAATATPVEPQVVPLEPMRDPVADALAAVAAEQARPTPEAEPWGDSPRVVPTMPEPELLVEPDELAYSSGDADTEESIGDLTAGDGPV